MTRKQISAEYMQAQGFHPAYAEDSNIPFSWEEIIGRIKASRQIELEISDLTMNAYVLVDGIYLAWRIASAEEIA